jgi:biofilm PGA synthesis lipoprotein PgaB
MFRRLLLPLIAFFLLVPETSQAAQEMKPGEFLVLTYHAVLPKAKPSDTYTLSQDRFVEQMEYLRTHGYHPVSLNDLLQARQGLKALPQKPVLLSFDDAYLSYYQFVIPVLEKYNFPSILGVVGRFIENPPPGFPEPLMSWDQLRQAASNKLVEVVSHTYDLHKAVIYNPQGNVGAAVALRAYDPATRRYESVAEYKSRMAADFEQQKDLFLKQLGVIPRAVIWPYGWNTALSREAAGKAGFLFGFTTEEGLADLNRLDGINRFMIRNDSMPDFIRILNHPDPERPLLRVVQADLDLIYDPQSEEQTDRNLGKLIDRLMAMKVNTVFLQAFADPEGTGNIKSVYFPNRVLPVRADIFSHAVHQMVIRGLKVYAWLPTLSIDLPDPGLNDRLKVREKTDEKTRLSRSWYNRLTPFDDRVRELVGSLYEDIAAQALIHGVLFQDDAYLTDREDFHPSALALYETRFGKDFAKQIQDPKGERQWARFKTETLLHFTEDLKERVRRFRPQALFARNLYARVLMDPEAENWFAQNYELSLNHYDYVVLMAYPQMEKAAQPRPWLRQLTQKVKAFPAGPPKTVFKLQSFDWQTNTWLPAAFLLEEMRDILSSGGRHIGYYPDNLWEDKPDLETVWLEMSTQSYPFLK